MAKAICGAPWPERPAAKRQEREKSQARRKIGSLSAKAVCGAVAVAQ